MKKVVYYLGLLILLPVLICAYMSAGLPAKSNEIADHAAGPGFVVMELFTSQGCSSCPPADEILSSYALKNDPKIFPISFHVDYWNRLGWTDPFSKTSYSERQRDYEEKFGLESVYTPQLIVNGQKEMNGSDKNEIESAVNISLNVKAAIQINITGINVTKRQLVVNYEASESGEGLNINAVLVQKHIVTKVKAGENRGRELNNYNVARDLKTNPLKQVAGNFILDMPAENDPGNFRVILFVQDKKTGSIRAAAGKDCQ